MTTLMEAIAEVVDLAAKAGAPLEMYANSIKVTAARQAEIDAANRSTDEEKATLHAYMEGLNGQINPEMPSGDICMAAGVRKNRGTVQYAAREKKRLLLTYHKTPTP